MAWEWSHSPEAYHHAEAQIRTLDYDVLRSVWAEWKAWDGEDGFSDELYEKALLGSDFVKEHQLAEEIWMMAEANRTCDNGGFNAWICPYGCHTVPFS